jgi:hypothetical protein
MIRTGGNSNVNSTERCVNAFSIALDGKVVCITQTRSLLRDSSCAHTWQISTSDDKEKILRQLEHLLSGDDEAHCFLRQRAMLMADEMLENALFAAPRDVHGRPRYAKGDQRTLLPGERITFCAYYDGTTLALEVTDTWGSLSPETVRDFIDMNRSEFDPAHDRAGRGLYFMWCFLQDFYLSVIAGVETTIGGLLQL